MFLLLLVMLGRTFSHVECKTTGYPLHSPVPLHTPLPPAKRRGVHQVSAELNAWLRHSELATKCHISAFIVQTVLASFRIPDFM